MSISVNLRGVGDMKKADYDPDKDGIIAIAQTEADMIRNDYDPNKDKILEGSVIQLKKGYVMSNDIIHSYDEMKSIRGLDYVKLKTITLNTLAPSPHLLRISFQLKASPDYIAYGKIYKNGDAHGDEHSTISTSYVTFTEDLEFKEGDTVELWITSKNATGWAYTQNLKILGFIKDFTLNDAIKEGGTGEDIAFLATNS